MEVFRYKASESKAGNRLGKQAMMKDNGEKFSHLCGRAIARLNEGCVCADQDLQQ